MCKSAPISLSLSLLFTSTPISLLGTLCWSSSSITLPAIFFFSLPVLGHPLNLPFHELLFLTTLHFFKILFVHHLHLKIGPLVPGLFFFIFRLFNTVFITVISKKYCQWLDSNRGSLVLDATALPTAPQLLPHPLSLSISFFLYLFLPTLYSLFLSFSPMDSFWTLF